MRSGQGVPLGGAERFSILGAAVRPREAWGSRTTNMTRYLWHFGAAGWPLERIDTLTGEHVPVFTGGPQETLYPQDGGRPLACSIPKVSGVADWDWA